MPPLLLLLLLLACGVWLCCGLELCAVAGADDDGVLLAGGLLVPDEPPQAVTSATSAAGMIIRRRFVIKNLLRLAGKSACGCSRTLQPSGSSTVVKSPRLNANSKRWRGRLPSCTRPPHLFRSATPGVCPVRPG